MPLGESFGRLVPGSVATVVRSLKSASTKHIDVVCNTPGLPVWQRNYYEHVIRDDEELNRIREYIQRNRLQWELDEENPHKLTSRSSFAR